MMSSNLLRSSSLFCQCNFQRQVEVIPGYYSLLDQLIAAFGDLLIDFSAYFKLFGFPTAIEAINSYRGIGTFVKPKFSNWREIKFK